MTFQRVKSLLDRRPFVPFNLHVADGGVVAVKSPEFIWLHPSKRVVFVATGDEENAEDKILDLLLVTQISTSGGFPSSAQSVEEGE